MTDDYSLLPHADSDDQQHPDPESDLFCRQITNNAIGDDGKISKIISLLILFSSIFL